MLCPRLQERLVLLPKKKKRNILCWLQKNSMQISRIFAKGAYLYRKHTCMLTLSPIRCNKDSILDQKTKLRGFNRLKSLVKWPEILRCRNKDSSMMCTLHLFWHNHNLDRSPMLARFPTRHLLEEETSQVKQDIRWKMYNTIIYTYVTVVTDGHESRQKLTSSKVDQLIFFRISYSFIGAINRWLTKHELLSMYLLQNFVKTAVQMRNNKFSYLTFSTLRLYKLL